MFDLEGMIRLSFVTKAQNTLRLFVFALRLFETTYLPNKTKGVFNGNCKVQYKAKRKCSYTFNNKARATSIYYIWSGRTGK